MGIQIDADRKEYYDLRDCAVRASSPETVEWALEDLYAAGGYRITAMALMRRIIDGTYKSPWGPELA
ncbi:MAG: hypothetical protein EOP62_14315 [Sphingomonadales bacterium]|nr:MAG: hypothetical protein EOP62_14315 [Sphingomonadales bacterium]